MISGYLGGFEVRIIDITGKGFLHIGNCAADVLSGSLCQHFNGSVGKVAHETGKAVPFCDLAGGKTETDSLNMSRKNNLSCNLFHFEQPRYGNPLTFILQ